MRNSNKIVKLLMVIQTFACISFTGVAQNIQKQNFILLDSLTNLFTVTHFTLKTKALYNIDKEIEIYNVQMRKGELLLVFSVLPGFTEKENWKKINIDSLKSNILSVVQIREYIKSTPQGINSDNVNTLQFGLIKKVGGSFYLSNNCLFERFNVFNYQFPLVVPRKVINIGSQAITIQEFLKRLPTYGFAMDPPNDNGILSNKELIENYYLSRKIIMQHDTAYQFWTFTDWMVADGWNVQRGIDRFVYIPGKGIVGGSYDFWFAFKNPRDEYTVKGMPVPHEKLWNNIINEKVMLAEELKK